MAEPTSEARIRDLKRRLELDPASRLFVSLAEEYRKAGRVADALITLQQGLRNHPGYVSAQVALGRAYLEAGNISEAIATFTKVLTADPGNLVSAKSLADVFLSRGESVEAIKKYKLYRALSGDRSVDEIVVRLEKEIAPPAPRSSRATAPPLPAPPTFFEAPAAPGRSSRAVELPESRPGPIRAKEDLLDVTSIKWDESTSGVRTKGEPASDMPTRPLPIDPALVASRPAPLPGPTLPPAAVPATAPAVDAPEPAGPFAVEPEAFDSAAAPPSLDEVFAAESDDPFGADAAPAPDSSERPTDRLEAAAAGPAPGVGRAEAEKAGEAPAEPQGRTLADLYFAQGHYTEALQIYDELVVGNPFDAELKRLRRDAEARLLPAGANVGDSTQPELQRRMAKIRALKAWLSVVQAG